MVEMNAVDAALETLRPSFAVDGFDLRAGQWTDDTVQVILEAKPGACLECLVPDDFMIRMIEDAIRREDPLLGRVELIKENFDTINPH